VCGKSAARFDGRGLERANGDGYTGTKLETADTAKPEPTGYRASPRPYRVQRLYPRRSDRSPEPAQATRSTGGRGASALDLDSGLGPWRWARLGLCTGDAGHRHWSDGAGLAASCEGRDGAPWKAKGEAFTADRSSILGFL